MLESVSENGTFVFAADDADFTSIQYDGIWKHTSGQFIGAYEGTGSVGLSGATASMNFTGFGVAAYAAIPKFLANVSDPASLPRPNVTVQIGDTDPTQVSIPLATQTPFYSNDTLSSDQPHTIQIRIDDTSDAFPFVLDLIAYATTLAPSATAPPAPSGSQQRLYSTAEGESAFFTPFASGTHAPYAPVAVGDGLPVGAIVGGVVGGVTLLLAAGLAFYFLHVRARQLRIPEPYFVPSDMVAHRCEHDDKQPLIAPLEDAYPAPPYTDAIAPSAPSSVVSYASTPPGVPISGALASRTSVHGNRPPSLSSASSVTSTSAYGSRPIRKAEEAGVLSVPPPTTYHADSGIRFTPSGPSSSISTTTSSDTPTESAHRELADVPPSYSAK
ncbi:hypothetical protein OH77DRAFT_1419263 [Trametes cingulata]|nr:hypothetical protein OH77DRAFT_1419263 [Trametes cingulata]